MKIEKGNCIELLPSLKSLKPKLIYIDPPFLTKKIFKYSDGKFAYSDKDSSDLFYLLENIHDILDDYGIICVHVDYRLQHIVRLKLEQNMNFVNQIIWSYKTGGTTDKRLSRKHDYIIVYSKNKKHTFNPILEKSYNRDFKPYRFKGVKEYQDDDGKWYTLVNMRDVWSDIPAVGRSSGERNGYPTQKPIKLLERIICLFSNEGDLVADLFCGSGTTLVAAKNLNREIWGCDINENAVQLTIERIKGEL